MRRPQLVRHVGQELRLVLAGGFDLATLLGDLSITGLEFLKQSHVFSVRRSSILIVFGDPVQ